MALLRGTAVPAVAVAGALASVSTVALHRTAFPAGLALAATAGYAVTWWLLGCRRRWLATVFAAGWLAVFAVLVSGRPEGDFVVAGDARGYALIVTALGLVVAGLVGLSGGRPAAT